VVKASIKVYEQSKGESKMRKVLIAMAVFVFQGVAFSGEINVKAGIDTVRGCKLAQCNGDEGESVISTFEAASGFSLAAEYLEKVSDFIKIGWGAECVLPKIYDLGGINIKSNKHTMPSHAYAFVYAPIYLSIQANLTDDFFLKGNLGYVTYFNDLASAAYGLTSYDLTKSGGLYFAISAGREFLSGLILDLTYSYYSTSAALKNNTDWLRSNTKFHRIALGVGYKFKLS
jgi:hypothetical protein